MIVQSPSLLTIKTKTVRGEVNYGAKNLTELLRGAYLSWYKRRAKSVFHSISKGGEEQNNLDRGISPASYCFKTANTQCLNTGTVTASADNVIVIFQSKFVKLSGAKRITHSWNVGGHSSK